VKRGKLTVSGEERNGCAHTAGTSSTTDTMDVVFRVVGVVIVENVSDVTDILLNISMIQSYDKDNTI